MKKSHSITWNSILWATSFLSFSSLSNMEMSSSALSPSPWRRRRASASSSSFTTCTEALSRAVSFQTPGNPCSQSGRWRAEQSEFLGTLVYSVRTLAGTEACVREKEARWNVQSGWEQISILKRNWQWGFAWCQSVWVTTKYRGREGRLTTTES